MNKLWIAGALACLSAVTVAQSNQSQDKAPVPGQSANAGDTASGQTAGKRMHKPITVTAEAGKDAATGKATGKSAHDDWQAPAAMSSQPKITENQRVAAGDVNGDGKADAAAPKSSGQPALQNTSANSTASDAKSPRDLATGQSSGKRQHQPVTTTKESDAKPAQK